MQMHNYYYLRYGGFKIILEKAGKLSFVILFFILHYLGV